MRVSPGWILAAVAPSLAAVALSLAVVAAPSSTARVLPAAGAASSPSPAARLLPTGRRLDPLGTQAELGNFTTGAAMSADGRWLWAVSTGFANDVRIVDTATGRACATLPVPGASGGIAIDSAHRRAYVSGLPMSRWIPTQASLPGASGNVVHVFAYGDTCASAREVATISVPVPADAPAVQNFNAQRPGVAGAAAGWADRLAVSPDCSTLLVPLNLADQAAIVDVSGSRAVRYVKTGHYPYAAAITPDGRTGLVTNEGTGSLSLIDLARGTKTADVQVGANLSHPLGVVVSGDGRTAYVAVNQSDWVSVVDLKRRKVTRTINVGRAEGRGAGPVALALTPDESRLLVANEQTDELAVVSLATSARGSGTAWHVIGRIPTASEPTSVFSFTDHGRTRLAYTTAKGFGTGANPQGPNPANPQDPIFWAFNPLPPTTDIFENPQQVYGATKVRGTAAVADMPSDERLAVLTRRADAQLVPVAYPATPAQTVVRPNGPIRHVFYVVRENRSYDQVLGTIGKGRSDPSLAVFTSADAVPNLHALANRFGLLDNVYANSEASIEGHAITATATVPYYTNINWWQNYAARGRPADQQYSISFPSTGSLFEHAQQEGVSYFNYGEALVNEFPDLPDKDRGPVLTRKARQVAAHSDIGPPSGCFPGSYTIGQASNGALIFDGSLPAGAPAASFSHVDCFTARFEQQLASGSVPALNYISLTGDHTLGTMPGAFTPMAMMADNDQGLGQLVDLISHSDIWASSAIFVVEDDSQDGADHVNARRIPALVISPYAKGGVISDRYDILSVLRTIELMLGMEPLTINDAMATPMFNAFANRPVNAAAYDDVAAKVDLLERNTAESPGASASQKAFSRRALDQVPQWWLDRIIWASVHGAASQPPPPGPDAVHESWAGDRD